MSVYETYIVRIGTRNGKRYADRLPLNIDLAHATGNLEDLSDMAVRDAVHDLLAEQQRRTEVLAKADAVAAACDGYDPFASQHRGGS